MYPASAKAHPSQPILFNHIPKTGGTAIHALLQEILGEAQCSPIITGSIRQARAEFDRHRCVTGHLFFHPLTDLSDLWTLTLLRHPLDRILSHLNYSRHDLPPSASRMNQQLCALGVAAYIDCDDPTVVDSISNTMVSHFATLAWDGVEPLTPDRQLALARDALQRFNLVGLTERIDETADLLCWALGSSAPAPLPRLNAGSRSPDRDSLPASTRDRLRKLNELDIELYAYAQELHRRCRRRAIFAAAVDAHAGVDTQGKGTPDIPAAIACKPADFGSREVELLRAEVSGQSNGSTDIVAGEVANLRILLRSHRDIDDLTVGVAIHDSAGRLVYATNTRYLGYILHASHNAECAVDLIFRADIGPGHYAVTACAHPGASHIPDCYHWVDDLGAFDIVGNSGWPFEGTTKLYPTLTFQGGLTARAEVPQSPTSHLQRLDRPAPALDDFRACIMFDAPTPALTTHERCVLRMEVENRGSSHWHSVGERAVHASYHWLRGDGTVVVFDGDRSRLPRDVAPGESCTIWTSVRAPDTAGDYRLQLSLVQESVAWLEERGGRMLEIEVTIRTQ